MQIRVARALGGIALAAGVAAALVVASGGADGSRAAALACSGGEAALAATGLCPQAALDLVRIGSGDAPELEQGCRWVPGETTMSGGDALLFLAAQCNGETAGLEFADGSPMMELQITHSAIAGDDLDGDVPVWLAPLEGADAATRILALAREVIEDPAEAESCGVRPAATWAMTRTRPATGGPSRVLYGSSSSARIPTRTSIRAA